MKINNSFRVCKSILPSVFLALILIVSVVNAREDGITGRTRKNSTSGCSCHGAANTATQVTVNGPSTVFAGQTYNYTITVNNAAKTGAGIDVAVRSGSLAAISSELRLTNSEIVHNFDIPMSSGQVMLQFSYTAPAFPTLDTIFYTGNATNSSGNSSGDQWNWGQSFRVEVLNQPPTLNLRAITEGFYNLLSGLMIPDTVRVVIRNAATPYNIVDVSKSVLNDQGNGTFQFNNVTNGTPYYIVVEHRNSIETWSAGSNAFISNSLTYDFTSASSQAYGDNMKLVGSKWTMFAGDVNQDGTVDGSDTQLIDNDAFNFNSGYVSTDVNGDSFVDGTDSQLTGNNSDNFVSKITP